MAKKKLTKRQRAANKRRSYIRSEYAKTYDAIEYMRDFADIDKISRQLNPTMRELKSIRKVYKQLRAQIQASEDRLVNKVTGELIEKLPTKAEMVREIRSEPTQSYRESLEEEPQAPEGFNPDGEYIDNLIQFIEGVEPRPYRGTKRMGYDYNRVTEAKNRLIANINFAVSKTSETAIATQLAADKYVDRVISMNGWYAHEIIQEIDENLIPIILAAVDHALNEYYND